MGSGRVGNLTEQNEFIVYQGSHGDKCAEIADM